MPTVRYYGASHIGPTMTKPARLRIYNIYTGHTVYHNWDYRVPGNNEQQVKYHHHSTLLKLQILFTDRGVLYFSTTEE